MSKARNTPTRRHRQKPGGQPDAKPQPAPGETPQEVSRDEPESIEYTPMSGCLCRIFWLLLGNVFLGLTAYAIALDHASLVSWKDVFFWLLVVALIAIRFVDGRYLKGVTTDGERATTDHWRRYSLQLIVIAFGLWLGVHVFAYFGAQSAQGA